MNTLSIILPVFNEEASIELILNDIKKIILKNNIDAQVIVVDDGSFDKTKDIIDQYKDIEIIHNKKNRGYGHSIKKGLLRAHGEWIAICDADGTYPIEEFSTMFQYTDQADMIVGSRTGKKVAIPLIRRPAKWFLNKLANYLVDYNIPDLNSGMRLFRRDKAMQFFNIYPEGFSFTTTITMAFISRDLEVIFHSINYYPRRGKSKIVPWKDMQNFLVTIVRTILYFNPLKVFLPLSVTFFIIACLVLVGSWYFEGQIRDATIIILLMTSFQAAAMGFLADLINRKSDRL